MAILDLIDSSPEREWTSRSVATEIRSGGAFRLPERDDAGMNAVAAALISLKEGGNIIRIYEGRGRDPHRYTSTKQASRAPQAIEPKIDLAHISKPGDVLKAILAKKQEEETEKED
jgi:hypothetical protein